MFRFTRLCIALLLFSPGLCGRGLAATAEERPPGAADLATLPPRRAPQGIPQDDPYLPTTAYLPPGTLPDPIHHLDTVRATWWGDLPPKLVERIQGDSPAQRVIFRDTLTGAEVWLICRFPGDEYEGFYSSLRNFNANGSMLEIDRHLMDVTGARPRPLSGMISREFDPSSIRQFQWDPNDPASGLCQRFSGAIHRFNVRTGEETPVFDPGDRFPRDCSILLTHDGRHMLVARQKNSADPFLYLADGRGKIIRRIELKTRSKDPAKDHMGGLHLFQDQDGDYFFIYSLNKAAARTTNPHQSWFAALDGSLHVPTEDLEGSLAEGYVIDGKRRLLKPAGYDPLSSAIGHAGMSPAEDWRVQSDGVFMTLTDLRTHAQKRLAYVPSADHFDWSARVDWFLHRTRRQPGLPIYRVEVPSGVAHRIVATNTDDHLACFSYSHPSPDGTKCLYRSSMLGNNDMYLAVIRHPDPPRELTLQSHDEGVRLNWVRPECARELHGYRIYRSRRSGGPYELLNSRLVTAESYLDRGAPNDACYVVTSVEHSGLESRRFSAEAALDPKGLSNLYLEAETAALTFPMREVFVPSTASAGHAITRAVRDPLWEKAQGNAVARWQVKLPREGDYRLWARVRSASDQEATVSFAVDGDEIGSCGSNQRTWRWAPLPKPRRFARGQHQLTAVMDRPGCELDKLLLTSDASLEPEAKGNLPTRRPATPEALRAQADETGRHLVLQWRHATGPLHHHFNVYKGASPDFQPSQGALLGSPTRTAFIDPHSSESGSRYYRVVAVDTWGNQSIASQVTRATSPALATTNRIRIDLDQAHLRGGLALTADAETVTGQFVALDRAGKNDFIEVPLSIPPGRYLLWVRARSKGRYQTARLEIKGGGRAQKAIVIGAESKLFGDPIWSWRRMQTLDSSTVPRRSPTWITVAGEQATLTIRLVSGYVELDQLYLTSSVNDLPVANANRYSPTNAYRFPWGNAAR